MSDLKNGHGHAEKKKLTQTERSRIVEDNLGVVEQVIAVQAHKGNIQWGDYDDWFQSLVTLMLEWDYIFDRYDPNRPLYPFISRIFHGMLADRYTAGNAFDKVTGDNNDFRRSSTDIETATEIIGIGATVVSYDKQEFHIKHRLVEFDQALLDGLSEHLRSHLGDDYYTVYQLGRVIRKASDIAAETGIPVGDVYDIKTNVERVSRYSLIDGKPFPAFREAGREAIRQGKPVGELPEITFSKRVDATNRETILTSIKPRMTKSWSEKYEGQRDNEITSAEIFRLMGDRARRLSNPFEHLRSMVRKGLIRFIRTKGSGNHTRYFYCRKSALELIELMDSQQKNEGIEAVRDRLLREANEADSGQVPSILRPNSNAGVEPSLDS